MSLEAAKISTTTYKNDLDVFVIYVCVGKWGGAGGGRGEIQKNKYTDCKHKHKYVSIVDVGHVGK